METRISIDTTQTRGTISRFIYGHFSEHLGHCIYPGLWVGENSSIPNTGGIRNDVIEALRRIQIPVLRWPGGCFADEYHWKDAIGPRSQRKPMVNSHWGGVIENNHFGTHEFLQLCELLGCEPYIAGNVGSGTVEEMQDWIEYINCTDPSSMTNLRKENGRLAPWSLKYFGVGNENWGCGGNMRPEYYADVYRRYQTYVRNYGNHKIYKIACGSHDTDYYWTEVLMREAAAYMDGLSLHYYTVPGTWANKGSATQFNESEWFTTIQKAMLMEEYVEKHAAIMDRYDPARRIGLIVDEWGTWYDVEPGSNPGFLYQQNTLRDALVAGITLNIFNNHCDRVHMANLAQTVNVLQALILADEERIVLTPTYHVFDMYKVHQDASLLHTEISAGTNYMHQDDKIPQVSVSASRRVSGEVNISLCNSDPHSTVSLNLQLAGMPASSRVSGRILTSTDMAAHNTFDQPVTLIPNDLDTASWDGSQLSIQLPPMCVAVVTIQ